MANLATLRVCRREKRTREEGNIIILEIRRKMSDNLTLCRF